jgi:hypothetical protein
MIPVPVIRMILAGTLIVGAGVFFTACDDDPDAASSETSTSQGAVDDLASRVQRNEALTAFTAIDALPLHDMDESINAGTIESSDIPNTRTLLRYIGITDWGELQSDVDAIQDAAVDLLAALDSDDVEAAKAPATAVHDLWHDFEGTFWAHVAADLSPEEGGPSGDDHSGGSTTPAADATGESGDGATPAEGGESH